MTEQPDPEAAPLAEPTYPKHWEADVVLSDGRTCHIRPIRRSDRDALLSFVSNLSDETLHMRFFTANPELAVRDAEKMLAYDQAKNVALLAMAGNKIIGVGNYDSVGRAEGELAFTIADDEQGRGLGSILLEHLAAIARENGIHRFRAEVLSGNRKMLGTFAAAGYSPSQEMEGGVALLDFDIDPSAKSRAVAQSREHRAEALAINRLMNPKRVAVFCDSLAEGKIGALALANLKNGGFTGSLVAIAPEPSEVPGVQSFTSIDQAEQPVDLVVMALPPEQVADYIPPCAVAGVLGIVLMTGGFVSNDDYSRQRELVAMIRQFGMRLVGPNALGLINTDPRVLLNASLVAQVPSRGRSAFFCQTGAFGSAILHEAQQRGLGVSTFISTGNRADVSANDMLQYWEDDETTSLVLLYLESIGNPRKFTRIARRLARKKPVVAVRSGRATQALPKGHAVRHTELPAQAVDAMFEQAGVIQVNTLGEMLDIAGLLAFQPLPEGNRVAIISDSEPLGILARDAAESVGLQPADALHIIDEPVTEAERDRVIAQTLSDPGVDAVIVTHVPPIHDVNDRLIESMKRLAPSATKPMLAVVLAHESAPIVNSHNSYGLPAHGSVPVFADAESAVRSLRLVVDYVEWLRQPRGSAPDFSDIEKQRARALVADVLGSELVAGAAHRLDDIRMRELLESYGMDLWPSLLVASEHEAVRAAEFLGYPVVLKTTAHRLMHRLDLGGLRVTLENEAAVRTAYMSMVATLTSDASASLVVQQMAPPGVACAITTSEDPLFGPIVTFRLGGAIPVILGDDGYRIPPLTSEDAAALVRAPKASRLLFGEHADGTLGEPILAVSALESLLARVGELADDLPELSQLELNPVVLHAKGVVVLGANATVCKPEIRTDLEARRLQ